MSLPSPGPEPAPRRHAIQPPGHHGPGMPQIQLLDHRAAPQAQNRRRNLAITHNTEHDTTNT